MQQVAVAAVIMEFLGAVTAGGKVSGSIQKGVLAASLFSKKEGLLQLAMVCALIASSSFLQFANYMAWPVSTTHSIVGGVMGTGIAAFGSSGILWDFSNCAGAGACTAAAKKIDASGNNKNTAALDQIPSNGFAPIAVSWVVSPVVAGVFGAAMFLVTRLFVLDNNFISTRISKSPFMRALYFAPFFYALIAGLMVVFLAYKIPATSVVGTQSGGIATLANTPEQLTAASCITAAVFFVLSAVYVSLWQYRYNWVGEDLHFVEWFYFFVLPKRPIREGFVPPTVDEEGGAAVFAEKTAKVPDEGVTALENPTTEVPSDSAPADAPVKAPETKFASLTDLEVDAQHKYDMAEAKAGGVLALLAAAPAPNLLLAEVTAKPIPAVIKAAMDVATEEGYVIRPMEESELVRAAWAKDIKEQGVMGMLMMPVKFLTYGIFGADGGARTVRAYKADTDEIKDLHGAAFRYDDRTELVFRQLQMITSLIASFAHGSNDVANAMGPLSAIIGVYWCTIRSDGTCQGDPLPNTTPAKNASATNGWATPDWLLAVGGIMIGLGFTVYGYHLMRSLGNNLTYHSPSRGYCMEFGASVTVLFASRIGLPISTTQAITGATVAIGLLNGLRGVNWKRFATIFFSWFITMPIVGICECHFIQAPPACPPLTTDKPHGQLVPPLHRLGPSFCLHRRQPELPQRRRRVKARRRVAVAIRSRETFSCLFVCFVVEKIVLLQTLLQPNFGHFPP